ncbi:MAG: LytTR family DNA-binding domain-containing protein [Lachnospiraceae bacterium]|nr:LytTR family DNA-binding domain-containing protein [Lachnospiraceae bacterium]
MIKYKIRIALKQHAGYRYGIFIAICDDENKIAAELERDLLKIFGKLNLKCEIDVYFTGKELCEKMKTGSYYDLIFLDIEFGKNESSGVDIGRQIREAHNNNMVSIIYISWYMKYSMQLFDIRPLNFLIKPLDYPRIENAVLTYLKVAELWSSEFTYKIGYDIFKVHIKDIIYLESNDRKLILHLSNGKKEEFYGSLNKIYQEQLKRFDFLFIHAKYVVNYDYVAVIKYNELILTHDNRTLPISQPKRKEIKAACCAIMDRRRMIT